MADMVLWAGLLVAGLVLGLLLGRLSSRSKLRSARAALAEAEARPAPPDTSMVVQSSGTSQGPRYLVEELFLLSRDGRLMAHMGQSASESDLVGSMLTAITDFITESFQHSGELKAIDHGDTRIIIESGNWVKLAVVVYGMEDEDFRELLTSTLNLIETHLQDSLHQWDGSTDPIRRARELLSPIVMGSSDVSREQIAASLKRTTIKLKTGWEFDGGLVMLRLNIINPTTTTLHSAQLSLALDHERIRLIRVETKLPVANDTVSLGQLMSHSEQELLFILNLLDCEAVPVEASLLYQTGAREAQQMVSTRLELICPAGFNAINANPPMCLRYMHAHLGVRDAQVLPIPGNLTLQDYYQLLRYALDQLSITPIFDLQTDRPFHYDGWYTGGGLSLDPDQELPFLFKVILDAGSMTLDVLLAVPTQPQLADIQRITIEPLLRTLDQLSARNAIEV